MLSKNIQNNNRHLLIVYITDWSELNTHSKLETIGLLFFTILELLRGMHQRSHSWFYIWFCWWRLTSSIMIQYPIVCMHIISQFGMLGQSMIQFMNEREQYGFVCTDWCDDFVEFLRSVLIVSFTNFVQRHTTFDQMMPSSLYYISNHSKWNLQYNLWKSPNE